MLTHDEICKRIPHTGNMCLLDSVKYWDDENIICLTTSHTQNDNPLRNCSGLPMSALIEYGAQAMAIHGGLLAEGKGSIMLEGYLAAIHDVKISQGWLSDIKDVLKIRAQRIYAEAGNMIYTMEVSSKNETLISGRATVITKLSDRGLNS